MGLSVRPEDWPEILNEQLEASRSLRFMWGESDCALWVSSVVAAMAGNDFLSDFRGQYDDRDGAMESLARIGSGTLRQTVTDLLGPEKPSNLAQRGDVVLVMYEGDEALGVCIGACAAVKCGFGWTTVGEWLTAWGT